MGKLSLAFIFGGVLLIFGAVGGMEDPEQAQHYVEQLAMAGIGLLWIYLGTTMLPKGD